MTFNDVVPYSNDDANSWLVRDLSGKSKNLEKAEKTASGANPIWKPISHALFSLIPFGIGNAIAPAVDAGADSGANAHAQKLTEDINKDRKLLGLDPMQSKFDVKNKGSIDKAPDLASLLSERKGKNGMTNNGDMSGQALFNLNHPYAYDTANKQAVHPWIQQLANTPSTPITDNVATDPAQLSDNPNAPAVTSGGVPLDLPTDNQAYDFNSYLSGSGETEKPKQMGYEGNVGDYRKGGTVKGPTHEKGGVALTKNGKHMGLEVEGGEKIVPADEWDKVLGHLKNGKHKKALALLEDIEDREPEHGKYAKGGKVVDDVKDGDTFTVNDGSGEKDNIVYKDGKFVWKDGRNGGELSPYYEKLLQQSDPKIVKMNLEKSLNSDERLKPQYEYSDIKGDYKLPDAKKDKPAEAVIDKPVAPINKGLGVGAETAKRTPATGIDPLPEKGITNGVIDPLADPAQERTIQPITSNSPAAGVTSANGTKPSAGDILGNIGGYGFDAMRLGMGLIGANTKLKDFNAGPEWNDYMDKARYFSNVGLTPEEKALANGAEQNNYGQAVNNLTNASGGNAGALLANLSAVNTGRGAYANALAVKDAELKQQHFENYAPILEQDIAFKKDNFDRHYNQDLATKQAGAQLASDAISNIKSRTDYNKAYGPNSAYDKFNKDLLAKGASEADILKAQADYWSNPANIMSTKTTPYNYHAYLPQ